MMLDVADPTDPSHQSAAPTSDAARAPERLDDPAQEIVDAEVVDESPAAATGTGPTTGRSGKPGAPDGSEDEAYRQYQQFLEFQKFQEWQRRHGDGATPPGAPGGPTTGPAPGRRPWWKRALRLLRFKLVRRLLYLLVFLLFVSWFIDTLDGGDGGSAGGGGSPGDDRSSAAAVLPDSPQGTVRAVYQYIATGDADVACALFTDTGGKAFAEHHGAGTCEGAARALHSRVADPAQYKKLGFGPNAVTRVNSDASVASCAMTVRGGPRLGKFGLELRPGAGWVINNYYKRASCSP